MDTRERVARAIRDNEDAHEQACPGEHDAIESLVDAILAIFAEERAAAAKASHAYADDCESLRELLEDAKDREAALVVALRKYGQHLGDCNADLGEDFYHCTCGLNEALAGEQRDAREEKA